MKQNKIRFQIEKLPYLVFAGDWHDKPLKWVARATEAGFTQQFSTKKDAAGWAACVRRSNTFNEAQALFQAL
jgi:hypothetical protein